jgi:uncharacterized protein YcbX
VRKDLFVPYGLAPTLKARIARAICYILRMATAAISALNIYPVKSCAGITLSQAELTPTGLAHDRQWMIVDDNGRFVSQREIARLALIKPQLMNGGVRLDAPGMPSLIVSNARGSGVDVTVWQDRCAALDEGAEAANWLSQFLAKNVRLVRFDDRKPRLSNREWTGDVEAITRFADGFSVLVIAEASLADLNERLPAPIPMNRFRPNVVLSGLAAYDEDRVHELASQSFRLRIVKPCTRCKITTIDQASGEVTGEEPLQTLKTFRFSRELRGVLFGQNAIVIAGAGGVLNVGQTLEVSWKSQ